MSNKERVKFNEMRGEKKHEKRRREWAEGVRREISDGYLLCYNEKTHI